jgi:hypothetical protein
MRRIIERAHAQSARELRESEGGVIMEILFYVLAVGIISSIIALSLSSVITNTAIAACEADGSTLQTGISTFQAENPTATVSGTATGTGNLFVNDTTPVVTKGAPFITAWPVNSTHYVYTLTAGVLYLDILPTASPGVAVTNIGVDSVTSLCANVK